MEAEATGQGHAAASAPVFHQANAAYQLHPQAMAFFPPSLMQPPAPHPWAGTVGQGAAQFAPAPGVMEPAARFEVPQSRAMQLEAAEPVAAPVAPAPPRARREAPPRKIFSPEAAPARRALPEAAATKRAPAKRAKPSRPDDADAFEYVGWKPPPRRERGSRGLGETVEPTVIEAPPPVQAQARPASDARAKRAAHTAEAAAAARADKEAREALDSLHWANLPDHLTAESVSPELDASLRILLELFSAKHLGFSRPFVSPSDARANEIERTLLGVRDKMISAEIMDVAGFAREVRHVFAACYLAHGHPDATPISRKCQRLDAVFEQNISLLPRAMRAKAVLVSLAGYGGDTGGAGANGEPAPSSERDGARRSSRARSETSSNVSTLQLVMAERQRIRGAQELLKRQEREKARALAEEWASSAVDADTLRSVRCSAAAVHVAQFLVLCGSALGIDLRLAELEMAIVAFPRASLLLRGAIIALLRAAGHRVGAKGIADDDLSAVMVEGALADAVAHWAKQLVAAAQADGVYSELDPTLEAFCPDGDMHDALKPLGDLGVLGSALRSADGLGALEPHARVSLLYALCEAVILYDHGITTRFTQPDGSPLIGGRARCLGGDSSGCWCAHHHRTPFVATPSLHHHAIHGTPTTACYSGTYYLLLQVLLLLRARIAPVRARVDRGRLEVRRLRREGRDHRGRGGGGRQDRVAARARRSDPPRGPRPVPSDGVPSGRDAR